MRQRRTVPLEDDDDGEHSIPTDESSPRSSAHAGSSGPSTSSSRSRRRRGDGSVSARRLEPVRNSFVNASSSHSRGSVGSAPSISVDDLKRDLYEQKQRRSAGNGSLVSGGPKTPSSRTDHLTIGNSSTLGGSRSVPLPLTNQTSISTLTDLFSLEEALYNCGDEGTKRKTSIPIAPVAWKTPFEVDAPRETASRMSRVPSPQGSMASEPDPQWSEEQDAWAGIDELLETKSLDGSLCFSTSEILPLATVRAMRGDMSVGASVFQEEAETEEELRTSKRSLGSISKTSSSSSNSRTKGQTNRRSKTEFDAQSQADSADQSEAKDKVGEPVSDVPRRKNRGAPNKRDAGAATQSGTLFDMFHWSEKDNVDELRKRKTKLNSSKPRRVKIVTNSNHGSDDCSLPSLASIRADDVKASMLDWDTDSFHGAGSVVSDHSRDESAFDEANDDTVQSFGEGEFPFNSFGEGGVLPSNGTNGTSTGLVGDGLVLDKVVDEYIRQIQKKLPTIVEDDANAPSKKGKKKKKQVGFEEETSRSPTSVMEKEESPFDELPSLTSFSPSNDLDVISNKANSRASRMEEKKEPKSSLSVQLFNSIKKMRSKTKAPKQGIAVGGDEGKYFPKSAKAETSKRSSANRCLLSEGDDGVNWD
jgi:hypothetical protein